MEREPKGLTRRDALRISAFLGVCTTVPYVAHAIGPGLPQRGEHESIFQADYPLMDPQRMVMSTCAGCRGNCPVRTQREVGILAKVDGNPFSPRQHSDPAPRDLAHAATLRGVSCARGQARVQNVHDPYRIVRALAPDGPRGSGRYRTVDAGTALQALLSDEEGRPGLSALRRAALGQPPGESRPILLAVDPRQQDRRRTVEAFTAAFAGATALLGHPAPVLAAITTRLLGTPGWLAAPRWDRAKALVAWGANPLAGGLDPVGTSWWMAERQADGARIISIDPRLSDVGALADLWIPVRPGGDRALAHWIARLWVEQGKVPEAAVPVSVRGRPVTQLEHRAGLGPRLVAELADALWAAGPGLALAVGGGVTDHEGGAATAEAILRLAVLAGAFGPGGAMEPVPDPIPVVDGPRALADALTSPHPPRVVLVAGDAGVQDTPFEGPVLKALADPARVPLVIAVTTAMNRVAWYADYVFPDVTEFERVGLVRRHDGTSVVLPVVGSIPAAAGLQGPAARGLGGLLQGLLAAEAIPVGLERTAWEALRDAAREADLPTLTHDETQGVVAALESRIPLDLAADDTLLAWLARGWTPPPPAGPPPHPASWTGGEAVIAEPTHRAAPILISFRETFGGQPDSDAQLWGARAVRRDNPLRAHPERIEAIAGTRADQVWVGEAPKVLARVRKTQGIRPDTVALAVGYGQLHGFDGRMVIDGQAVPPSDARCCGVPVGPVLRPERTIALAWGENRRDPSLWDLLRPGGHRPLPSMQRKHDEDL